MTELAGVLTSRLQALWGTAVEVTAVRPLPGGASRESWDVLVRTAGAARLPAAERRLILLRDAGGRARAPARNIAVEAAAMIAARAAGVPVAELYDHVRAASIGRGLKSVRLQLLRNDPGITLEFQAAIVRHSAGRYYIEGLALRCRHGLVA